MKRKVKELKRIARGNLTGNYMILMRAYLWVITLPLLVEIPFSLMQTEETWSFQNIVYFIAQILINIVAIVVVCGQNKIHLAVARTGKADLRDLFEPLRNQPDRYILTNFILFGILLICFIPTLIGTAIMHYLNGLAWTLITIVLDLISMVLAVYILLTYNLVFYVLVDHPDMTAGEALKTIAQIVKTHRKRYLYMQFSFLGMMFLSVLSLGIGMLWVEPYITQTTTLFYLDSKGELDAIQTERRKSEETPAPTMFNQYV